MHFAMHRKYAHAEYANEQICKHLFFRCQLTYFEPPRKKLWFVEPDVLLIILTILGGLLLLYQHGVGINMVENFRPVRPEVVVRYRNTLL